MIGSPPDADEIEVTLLGPGYGESVVVHMGGGAWAVIDSCRARPDAEPAALAYFDEIGVRPERHVEIVVASHFHDDHTRGLADVLAACSNADFCCANAFSGREAAALLHLHSPDAGVRPRRGKLRELYDCFEIVRGRGRSGGVAPLRWASADRPTPLWRDGNDTIRLTSLSPTQFATAGRVERFASVTYAAAIDPASRHDPFEPAPNDIAVALHLEVGEFGILLGSDLEAHPERQLGWRAVIDGFPELADAELVKVPHHGSENAFVDEMWGSLAPDAKHGVLTPFRRGKVSLPTPQMAQRLCACVGNELRSTVDPFVDRPLAKPISDTIAVDRGELLPMGRVTARRPIAGGAGVGWRTWRSSNSAHLCADLSFGV